MRLVAVVVVLAAVLAGCGAAHNLAELYENCACVSKDFRLFWTVDEAAGELAVGWEVDTQGWAAFGPAADAGADLVVVHTTPDARQWTRALDVWVGPGGWGAVEADLAAGGGQSFSALAGEGLMAGVKWPLHGGLQVAEFRRPLNATDAGLDAQVAGAPGAAVPFAFAYGGAWAEDGAAADPAAALAPPTARGVAPLVLRTPPGSPRPTCHRHCDPKLRRPKEDHDRALLWSGLGMLVFAGYFFYHRHLIFDDDKPQRAHGSGRKYRQLDDFSGRAEAAAAGVVQPVGTGGRLRARHAQRDL